jgi:predicted transcriptional regulator
MIGLYIAHHLMRLEGGENLQQGRLVGFSISYIQKECDIPKASFYRAVKKLINDGYIVKQKRNSYCVSQAFRIDCNQIINAQNITV